MAATSAARSWSFARRALVTSAAAAVGLVALAIPASAHTPTLNSACDKEKKVTTVDVKLTAYNDEHANHVTVTDNGTELVDKDFGKSFEQSWSVPADVDHEFVITVKAWDDTKADDNVHWSFEKTLAEKACVEKEQPPTEQPPAEQPPVETTTTQPPAPPTTTTPPAVGANANLAETGASIAIPLAVGALLLVGGGVLLLIMRRRGRA